MQHKYISVLIIVFIVWFSPVPALTQCDIANSCSDITAEQTLLPQTVNSFHEVVFDYACVSGCLDSATPESDSFTCGFDINPTVWYAVEIDSLAEFLFITVRNNEMWDPLWAVFYGDNCGNLQILDGSPELPPCSYSSPSYGMLQVETLEDIDNYYIAITADPNSQVSDAFEANSDFELCVSSSKEHAVCLGEFNSVLPDSSFSFNVIGRSCGGELNGPFYPGEEIIVELDYVYDATVTGADWLIGIIPDFGKGWDLAKFDFSNHVPIASNTLESIWHEESGECAPILQEPLKHFCTYTDEEGRLHICNGLEEACPCELGMSPGNPLPSGWFWTSEGSNQSCTSECTPGTSWGVGSDSVNVRHTFVLTVKEFDNLEECLLNDNLQISFQTFSDGTAGCWDDPVGECLTDRKLWGPKWKVDCDLDHEPCTFYKLVYDLFIDYDVDGIHDDSEPEFYDGSILINESGETIYNHLGSLNLVLLDEGDYTIAFNSAGNPDWVLSTPETTSSITVNDTNPCDTVRFGVYPANAFQSTASYFSNTTLGCNGTTDLRVYGKNDGTLPIQDGILWVSFDEKTPIVSYAIEPDTIQSATLIGWNVGYLNPSEFVRRIIKLDVPGPPSYPIGTTFTYHTYIESYGNDGQLITNSAEEWEYELECSFDPNDKLVNPGHLLGYTNIMEDELEFTVRFQNTGNIAAERVIIRDTIQQNLDINTFTYLGSSHEAFLSIRQLPGRAMEFRFDDINLPDSTSNFDESQGYIMFSFEIKDSIEEGTLIENTAAIFFDSNPPVITNTTRNIFYYDIDVDGYFSIEDCDDNNAEINPAAIEISNNGIDEDCDGEDLISSVTDVNIFGAKVFPNPFDYNINIEIDRGGEFEVKVFGIDGKKVGQSHIFGNQITLDLTDKEKGIYLIQLEEIATGRKVIHKMVKM